MNNSEIIIVDDQLLENYWNSIFGSSEDIQISQSKGLFVEGFKNRVSTETLGTFLFLNTSVYRIELKKSIFHHIVTLAITDALIQHFDISEIPIRILEVIVSTIFDINRIKISTEHETIYLNLILKEKEKVYLSAEEWYKQLPEEISKQVNESDFKDFLEMMVYSGYALSKDNKYLVLTKKDRLLKIYIQ